MSDTDDAERDKNLKKIAELTWKALREAQAIAHPGEPTEASIKHMFQKHWNNDLMLSMLAEVTTGFTRETLLRRVKFLDFKSQAIKLLIFATIAGIILFFTSK